MKTETNSGPKPNANPLKTSSTSARSGKHQQIEKMTRWDRITKKHLNTVNVQTAQVRRIFDLNFVSGDQMQHMSGRGDVGAVSGRSGGRRRCLDPALVMDMRHEIVTNHRLLYTYTYRFTFFLNRFDETGLQKIMWQITH